jgi:pilus assembly protein CpaC
MERTIAPRTAPRNQFMIGLQASCWTLMCTAMLFAQGKKSPAAGKPPVPKITPARLEVTRGRVQDLISEIREAEAELKLKMHRAKLIRTKADIERVAVADPSILDFIAFGPREIQFVGKALGSTTVTFWHGGAGGAPQKILSLLVTVERDREAQNRRRLEYGELQKMINEMFPNSRIQLIPIADKVIVRGQARDEQEAVEIMSILRQRGSIPAGQYAGFGYGAVGFGQGTIADPFPEGADLPQAGLISMLKVPGEKQVMLKVRIAELTRSAVRNLGVDFNIQLDNFALASTMTGGAGNIFTTGTFGNNAINVAISALESNGTAKILAEPSLVVLSGQTASFIAGGSFAVPTVVGVGGVQAATTSFQGFGTQLTFTPTILDKDRIRLQVAPSFSTVNSGNSVNGIPGLNIRSVITTVDLRESQVFAIAGLMQEQQNGASSRLPFFGRIPLVKMLFSSKSISRDEKELMILVSPELVHPLEPEDAPVILPGMEVTEPDDLEFFLHGQIEGRPGCDHRSTVWWKYTHDLTHAKRDYKRARRAARRYSDNYYINGPHGFSD